MWEYNYSDELYHFGVKGMKWGVRRQRKQTVSTSSTRNRYDSTKAEYKTAKKTYDKSFSKAYNRAIAAYSPSKKQRAANDARWEQAYNDAVRLNQASKNYKQAKRERKQQIKSTYKSIQKSTSIGEKLIYNNATRKKAAKYVVDNNMTMSDATRRARSDANRNTALFVAACGTATLGSMYLRSR